MTDKTTIKNAEGSTVAFSPNLKGRPLKIEGIITGTFYFNIARNIVPDIYALNALADTPLDTVEEGWFFAVETPAGATECFSNEWITDFEVLAATSTFQIRLTGATMDDLQAVLGAATSRGVAAEVVSS